MENNNSNNKKLKLGLLLLLLLLLIGSCGILSGLDLFKQDNSMSVVDGQDNLPSPLVYSSYEQNETFTGAQEGEGEITYTLIRALDEKGIYVDYFSLLDDKSTQIVIAPNTPAGTYELLIRATAAGDGSHKSSSKEFKILVTVNKAAGSFDTLPTPIEGLIYNGELQTVVNPGSSSTGTIYYKVDDGEWSTNVPQLKDAGTYTIYYKLVGDRNHTDVGEQSFTVTIERSTVGNKPQSQTVIYDGKKHTLNYSKPAHVIQQGDPSGTNAGEYKATYTPESNYYWNDGTNNPVTATLTISRAVVNKPTSLDVARSYTGSSQNNGYSKPDGVTMTGNDSGTNPGEYKATYTPDANHIWNDGTTDSVTVTLTISKITVNKPTETSVVTTYNGSTQNNGYSKPNGVTMTGKDSGINAGEYTATYTLQNNYVWNDGTTDPVTVVLTINKAKLPIPTLAGIDGVEGIKSVEYDRHWHRANLSEEYDSSLIRARNTRARRETGEYTITLSLRDTVNYEWSDDTIDAKEIKWAITAKKLTVPTVTKTFTYKPRTRQGVTEKDLNPNYNNLVYFVSNDKHINAGDYTVTVGLRNKRNYCWVLEDGTTTTENQTIPWTINKAKNTIDIDKWQAVETRYSANEQTVAFRLPRHAKGEVTYEVKSARYAATLIKTDNISIKDDKLCLKPGTNVGIYEVVVGVHAAGDDNYLEYDGQMQITLTVKTPNYVIKFDGNGSDRGAVVDQDIYGVLVGDFLHFNQYVRDAYEFTGWNTETDGSGESFKDKQYVTYLDLAPYEQNGTITLYAQWAPKTLKVTYNLDGGSFKKDDVDDGKVVYEYTVESDEFKLCEPVKTHYDFAGWSGTGLSEITKDVTVVPSLAKNNCVFDAHWTGAKTTLLLLDISNIANSRIVMGDDRPNYGEKYGDSLPKIGKDGYYGGWYTLLGKEVTSESIVVESISLKTVDSVLELIGDFVPEQYQTMYNIITGLLKAVDLDNTIILIGRETPYTNISYKVHHYAQRLDLVGYDELKTETRFGSTDAEIKGENIALNITGFTLNNNLQAGDKKINADGSSEVYLYYDRDLYDIVFDSRGGTDVETQQVPYDGLVTEPEDPVFGDKEFSGWYYNGKPFDFDTTRIRGKITLYAKWDVEGYVKVIAKPLDPETGGVSGSGVYEVGEEVVLTAYANENYRFAGWTDGNTENPRTFTVTKEDAVEKTLEFVAKFEKISSRSLVKYDYVTYSARPGDVINVTDVFTSVLLIDDFRYVGGEDNPLTFDLNKSIIVNRNRAYVYVDEEATDGTYSIDVTVRPFLLDLLHRTSTIKIYVEVESEKYAVRFNSLGGTLVDPQYVPVGETANKPADPEREGYDFNGWYLNGEIFDFNTPITKEITLEASWLTEGTRTIEVVSDNDEYGSVSGSGYYYNGENVLIKATPNAGYKFINWNNDPDLNSSSMMITVSGDAKYVAYFDILDDAYFKYNEMRYLSPSNNNFDVSEVFYNFNANDEFEVTPNNENTNNNELTFRVDNNKPKLFVSENAVPGTTYSIKVNLKDNENSYIVFYVETECTVDFDYSGVVSSWPSWIRNSIQKYLHSRVSVEYNSTVDKPDFAIIDIINAITKYFGYTIDKNQITWYLDGALYDFDTPVTSSITLKLGWRDKYTVKFMLDNETEYSNTEVIKGEQVSEPVKPTKEEKIFQYWKLNDEKYDFSQPVNSDITLVAEWKDGITVTFDYNDNLRIAYETVASGDTVTPPKDTVSNGRVFDGWYLNGEKFDFDTPITETITLEAKWIEKEYQVLYETNGGTPVSIKNNVHWNDNDLTPASNPYPILPIYVFTGWYVDEACTIPYRNQTYAELVNYNDEVEYVVLYAGWYDRSIVHYTDKFTSIAGEEAEYVIKTDDDFYLLFSEYEILDASESGMFRMSKNNDSVIISSEAEPGTYYIKVSSVIKTPIDYIYEITVFDHIQTIMIEWTVVEAETDDETGPLSTNSVGDGLTADPVEGSDPIVGQDGDENDQVDAQGSGQSVDETVPGTDDDNVNPLTNPVGANNDLVVNTNQQNVGTEETEEEEQNDSSQVTDNGGTDVTIPETVNGEGGEENTNNPETVEGE